MKKQVTLILASAALIFSPAWSQVANNVTDSLAGFNNDSIVDITLREHLQPFEAASYLAKAKETYIAKRYDLNGYNEKNGMIGIVSPQSACTNMGFETGDFTGWQGAIGDNTSSSYGPLQNIQTGIFSSTVDAPLTDISARHTIMTPAAGNDPCGGFPIVPGGYGGFVARIGNNGNGNPNYMGEILEQTFVVDPNNTQFSYRYAAVLNDGGHNPGEQPYFKIEVLDSLGQPVSPCAQYYVEAGGSIPGFVASSTCTSTYYKPWSPVTVDLSNYINHSVTVRFTAGGCLFGGHYAYAYIDCSCANIGNAVSAFFCPGSNGAFLIAPSGFGSYQWYDPSGNIINGATNDSLFANTANANDTFSVVMASLSDTNCHTTLYVVVNLTPVLSNPTSIDPTCYGFTDGSATENCLNCFPPVSYTWTSIPAQNTQTALNLAAGQYLVTIVDSIGCTKIDTVFLNQPPRPDTSALTYHYCNGDPTVTLVALPGEPGYQWLDPTKTPIPGATAQSYVVNAPVLGDIYYCIYASAPCPILDSVILNYIPPAALFSPDSSVNVFTPNGDQKNDYFYPYFDASVYNQTASAAGGQPAYNFYDMYIGTFEIYVYNRWGQQVFYSNDYTYGWDGKIDGKDATPGVYFWVAKFTTRCRPELEPVTNTGFVHLIR
jgi:hypothetical protein